MTATSITSTADGSSAAISPNTPAGWRSPALGAARDVTTRHGTVRVYERGSGAPIVLVHGVLVNANLWRGVVDALADRARCIAIELPFGSHTVPVPGADLSPPGVARLIADTLAALEVEDVTLVGNDTGGAMCQLVATRHPERLGRLVLTSCDAFDNFPPPAFRPLVKAAASVPGVLRGVMATMRSERLRRLPIAFGWLTQRPIERAAVESYVLPCVRSAAVRHDARRAFADLHPRYTLEAAERLRRFERPALIAWSSEDRFFPAAHAERLAATIPGARLEWIEGARTFSPEDRPDRLAELIGGFAGAG